MISTRQPCPSSGTRGLRRCRLDGMNTAIGQPVCSITGTSGHAKSGHTPVKPRVPREVPQPRCTPQHHRLNRLLGSRAGRPLPQHSVLIGSPGSLKHHMPRMLETLQQESQSSSARLQLEICESSWPSASHGLEALRPSCAE